MIIPRRIAAAATLIMLGNAASRLLGVVREQVIAGLFSTSATTSSYVTASTIPTAFYDLLIGGAISAALVPVLSDYAAPDSQEDLGAVVSTMLTIAGLLLLLTVGLLLVGAPAIVPLLGVSRSNPIYPLTVQLVRIVLPGLLFLGLAGVIGAVAYARQQFIYPAFAIALYNFGFIIAALALTPLLGARALAVGVLSGAFLQCVCVAPSLRGLRIRPSWNFRHPAIVRIVRLYLPVALGLVVSEAGVFIDRNLAWSTGPTSAAVMRFATTLVQFPLGLVGTALALAILPTLARQAGDLPLFRQTLGAGARLGLLAILPATVGLVLLREPIVRLLFQHHAFDASATLVTAHAFLFYSPQLPFVVIDQLLVFAFYARKNTVTPMLVGVAGVLIYLTSGLLMIGPLHLGLTGLIIANTLQNSLHAIILIVLLSRAIGSLANLGIGRAALQGLLASGAVGLLLIFWQRAWPAPTSTLHLIGYLGITAALATALYALILLALQVEEILAVRKALRI